MNDLSPPSRLYDRLYDFGKRLHVPVRSANFFVMLYLLLSCRSKIKRGRLGGIVSKFELGAWTFREGGIREILSVYKLCDSRG